VEGTPGSRRRPGRRVVASADPRSGLPASALSSSGSHWGRHHTCRTSGHAVAGTGPVTGEPHRGALGCQPACRKAAAGRRRQRKERCRGGMPEVALARERRQHYRENMRRGFDALAELYYVYWVRHARGDKRRWPAGGVVHRNSLQRWYGGRNAGRAPTWKRSWPTCSPAAPLSTAAWRQGPEPPLPCA
jgi:hypothetical protein